MKFDASQELTIIKMNEC